jgi:uridine phosphorylase
VYRELTPDDHRRVMGVSEADVPDVLLVVGAFDVHTTAERFITYLQSPQRLRAVPCYLGRSGAVRVGLAACFGGPMAAQWVHTFCAAGTPRVVQLGWFGALQPGMALGDVVVPRHAERADGVSDWYLAKGILADATPALATGIAAHVRARGIPVNEHAIVSTPALLAESREVISDWSRHGWQGVDMETATTFAVAKALGAERAAALLRFDDLLTEEDSVAARLPNERLRVRREREAAVVASVLDAVRHEV